MDKRKSMKLKMLLACVMVLICAVVAVNVLAADRSKDAKMPAATKWQYLAMTHDLALDAASRDLGRRITQIGQDGW